MLFNNFEITLTRSAVVVRWIAGKHETKERYKDMIRTEIKAYTEKEMRDTERKLKETGYTKTNDCMWVKIYAKNNNEIVLTKEY